ncbi:MAG: response regulator transcription factor [Planctomycetes bacterium]|nr:response regulator transcription factor [Planctomycetota bacterium]
MLKVAFIGSKQWLRSEQVLAVRDDPRTLTVGSLLIGDVGEGTRLGSAGAIVLVQTGPNIDQSFKVIATLLNPPKTDPTLRVIATVRHDEGEIVRRCVEADVWAMLLESATVADYQRTIQAVAAGRLTYPPHVLDRVETRGGRMRLAPGDDSLVQRLTPAERELLILLANGLTAPQAASAMSVPVVAARQHRAKLMRKLGVRNRAALVRLAIRAKLIEP